MPLTRDEADQIVEEARQQGWTGDEHIVDLGGGDWYNEGRGRVEVHDWDAINRERIALGNNPWAGTGCSIELVFPAWEHPKYWVTSREEWRQLKAKVDELKEIMAQIVERGWAHDNAIVKRGRFSMAIREVYPPGYRPPYGVSVGGMRTWRKLCREADAIIEPGPRSPELPAPAGGRPDA